MTLATSTSHTMDAHTALVATKSFGVGRGFAVLVAIFALMLGLVVLGGHLRASWQRTRTDKRPYQIEDGAPQRPKVGSRPVSSTDALHSNRAETSLRARRLGVSRTGGPTTPQRGP
jgi:hypothetical protein